jgi:acetyl esterase/lipase
MTTRDSTIREGAVRTTTIHHPIHLLDRVAMAATRLMIASMKGSVTGPSAREPFDELMEKTPAADGVTYEEAEVGGVAGWWCRPDHAVAGAAILYFHGGAYVVGSARAFQHFVGQVAARAKVVAFVPEYGLAPEHPFPAAVDEAQTCYRVWSRKVLEKSRWRATLQEAALPWCCCRCWWPRRGTSPRCVLLVRR